jgi:hypothetical protein
MDEYAMSIFAHDASIIRPPIDFFPDPHSFRYLDNKQYPKDATTLYLFPYVIFAGFGEGEGGGPLVIPLVPGTPLSHLSLNPCRAVLVSVDGDLFHSRAELETLTKKNIPLLELKVRVTGFTKTITIHGVRDSKDTPLDILSWIRS